MFDTQVGGAVRQIVGPWWACLIAGLSSFVISFVVLQISLTSVRAVGVLLGVVFLVLAVEEFMAASVVVVGAGPGWSWASFSSPLYGPSSTPSVRSFPLLTCSGCS